MNLFVDTWGWLTIMDRGEPRSNEVREFYSSFIDNGGIVCTTDYVLDETFTLVFRRLPSRVAGKALDIIDRGIAEGYLRLEWIIPNRFDKAKTLRVKFKDKPRISFTDLTSMVVMQELRISDILTEDVHFSQVGMGLRTLP